MSILNMHTYVYIFKAIKLLGHFDLSKIRFLALLGKVYISFLLSTESQSLLIGCGTYT